MNEEVYRNSIHSRKSSFGSPRFLGVPSDNQLREDSSMEGILHGGTISKVHGEDTDALERAGVSWERAGYVLSCLGAVMTYATRTQRSSDFLPPHFNNTRAGNRHSFFQFDNPIRGADARGDPTTPLEIVADAIGEFDIQLSQEGGDFTTSINRLTLYLATAHHLLEKGNRYAMTGEQLAILVAQFDKESFNADEGLHAWMAEKTKESGGPYKAITGHEEKVKFIDGVEFDLKVRRYGALSISANSPELRLLQLHVDKDLVLNSLKAISNRFNIDVGRKGDRWYMGYCRKDNDRYVEEEVPPDSPLWTIIGIGTSVIDRAKNQQDGVLANTDAQALHALISNGMNLPETAIQ